ncbi:MAG: nicotinate (nicotinamide) nucleotide adenylyltransferase [Erysipelotrichaceae bacterium]|nr:nicotinate (nicotinamide) nucleotide adenylyltransferase [Erysipelotrichaceae bacterium]
MKIGIYSGSFAPVHKGHIKIVREVLKSKSVDKVLIVPTKEYWDKKINYSLKDRINMLKLYETKHIEIDTKLNNTNGTYELLSKYQSKHPNDEFYLILGADNLTQFEKWINYRKLLEYPFIIIKRDKQGCSYIKKRMKELNKTNYIILDIPNIEISSTFIRENINNPKLLRNKIDPRVYNYIKNKAIS